MITVNLRFNGNKSLDSLNSVRIVQGDNNAVAFKVTTASAWQGLTPYLIIGYQDKGGNDRISELPVPEDGLMLHDGYTAYSKRMTVGVKLRRGEETLAISSNFIAYDVIAYPGLDMAVDPQEVENIVSLGWGAISAVNGLLPTMASAVDFTNTAADNANTSAAETNTAKAETIEATKETIKATEAAYTGADNANTAAQRADIATENTNIATELTKSATLETNKATAAANNATENTIAITEVASIAISKTDTAADNANTSAAETNVAKAETIAATEETNKAADRANTAADNIYTAIEKTETAAESANTAATNANNAVEVMKRRITETEIIIDTPVWAVQPVILNGEELNPAFTEGSIWFTTSYDTVGAKLPDGHVKLTKFHGRNIDAVDQVFDFSAISGKRDSYAVQFTSAGIRDAGVQGVSVTVPIGKRLISYAAGFEGIYNYILHGFSFNKTGKGYSRGYTTNTTKCSITAIGNLPVTADYTNPDRSAASFFTSFHYTVHYGKNITSVDYSHLSGKVGDNGSGATQTYSTCFLAEEAKMTSFSWNLSNSYQQAFNGGVISFLWEEI